MATSDAGDWRGWETRSDRLRVIASGRREPNEVGRALPMSSCGKTAGRLSAGKALNGG